MKNIVTITGIRPDFIRMSEIFRKLDENFNHTLIHTGQHYDALLSDVFFKDLKIRKPDFNLEIGGSGKEHYQQNADLNLKLFKLFSKQQINPDLIIFLGDSNSVLAAVPLKKEGYKIAHIEAGMRSGDKRMLEEINRTVCDHCSDYHFVYHEDYKQNLIAENLPEHNIHVVGNTIVEVLMKQDYLFEGHPLESHIILDIHRPENFKYERRLRNIIFIAIELGHIYNLPVKMLKFNRTLQHLNKFNIKLHDIELVDLMSYQDYLTFQYNSKFIISDSGTAQEEPALFDRPVIVPRDYTERPQSMKYNCSYMLNVNDNHNSYLNKAIEAQVWLEHRNSMDAKWLGNGNTSELILNTLERL